MSDIFGREGTVGRLAICNLKTGKDKPVGLSQFGVITGNMEAFVKCEKSVRNLSSYYLVENPSKEELVLLNELIQEYGQYVLKEEERKKLLKQKKKEEKKSKVDRKFQTGDLIMYVMQYPYRYSNYTYFHLVITNCEVTIISNKGNESKVCDVYLPVRVRDDMVTRLESMTEQIRLWDTLFEYANKSLDGNINTNGLNCFISRTTPSEYCGEKEPTVIHTNFQLERGKAYTFEYKSLRNSTIDKTFIIKKL